MIRQTVLHNGITIVTREFAEANSVYMHWSLDGGSSAERKGEHGANHFLEHQRCSRQHITIPIENMGCEINALTTAETTQMYAHVWPGIAGRALKNILVSGLKTPVLEAKNHEIERMRVIAELGERNKNVNAVFADETNAFMFGDAPRGHRVGGLPEDVVRHDFNTLAKLHQRQLAGPAINIVVSGKINHDDVVRQVNQCLGDVSGKAPPKVKPSLFRPGGFRLLEPSHGSVDLMVQYKADAQGSPRRPAFLILQELLAGSRQSYLLRKLSFMQGLLYSASAEYVCWRDDGVMALSMTCQPELAQRTVNGVARMMTELPDRLSQRDFERTKKSFAFRLATVTETPESWGARTINDLAEYGYIRSLDEIRQQFAQVSFKDVQKIAREMVARKPFVSAMGVVEDLRIIEPFAEARTHYRQQKRQQKGQSLTN